MVMLLVSQFMLSQTLSHPIPAGISNDPTNAVAMTVNNEAQYSAGTGGGIRLKLAVKVPY